MIKFSSTERSELDRLCINTVRALAMDAVQQAKSGYPGTAMALAGALRAFAGGPSTTLRSTH